ncbi:MULTISPECIES: hypothetical protein [Streptomyces]|uniref:Uncharacterized protein n=2 Tax=Streptomyces TaxID=1883 RepID=A0ABS3WR19_9ACTN|nr:MULTISPECIES: hypothetical protein [Streptomyces]MBQ1158148.1 hypothetical protein [Streptomyces sp. A73]MBO8185563.1 hypothetical protein [Streptomyces spirodelae]MBO8201779.1 hypothetical protein [Streptomyces smyrnaeus]MBQ0866227.1 hypothetical protein [Streptomyces sp. RK75]MBQ1121343.1 hypothetical protein [Streptomyces sp. B15]
MEQITVGSRARVPAIKCGTGATSSRLDRHLSVLAGPAVPQGETEDATTLMREITQRDAVRSRASNRGARVSLFAPLRKLRRTLFGGRG